MNLSIDAAEVFINSQMNPIIFEYQVSNPGTWPLDDSMIMWRDLHRIRILHKLVIYRYNLLV